MKRPAERYNLKRGPGKPSQQYKYIDKNREACEIMLDPESSIEATQRAIRHMKTRCEDMGGDTTDLEPLVIASGIDVNEDNGVPAWQILEARIFDKSLEKQQAVDDFFADTPEPKPSEEKKPEPRSVWDWIMGRRK